MSSLPLPITEMELESTNSQDARIEELFRELDVDKKGHIDLEDLHKGLKKIDHPMKNAEPMIEQILKNIDANHDGRISFEEFCTFVKHTETELRDLFQTIDRNRDGRLEKVELQAAFRRAGLTVSNRKLEDFFSRVDKDHDGSVSFEEWRDFLLFLPSAPNLENVLSYYTTTVRVSSEGDVFISDDAIEGLGTFKRFLKFFFASLLLVNYTPAQKMPNIMFRHPVYQYGMDAMRASSPSITAAEPVQLPPIDWTSMSSLKAELMLCVPSTGYFAAGGLAGVISRSATAPLDRLKVYLIAQISNPVNGIQATKHFSPAGALAHSGRVFSHAIKDLWAAGGVRSLYAGNGINIVKVMPETSIKFGFFEGTKRICARLEGHNNEKKISLVSKLMAGGIGGMASQFSVYPLDTLKFRMQCETVSGGLHGNQLIWATAKKMWLAGGIKPFYKGATAGLVGVFPYAAIDLGTFEYLKTYLTEKKARELGIHEEDAAPKNGVTAAIGGFAGALGASLVYPINLIRTRLQTQGTVLHPRTYNGFWDAASVTVKGEGAKGLFKGLTPNLIKVVPAVSITYVVYENAKKNWGLK
ncbi:calcium dependent mitochondrial carrier protein-like protein [Microthyrium microscopicum]|uniref:Mitochondrial thiamine pyrophosphate carrier 1 n=1 Tax=Microthyrium microscopicum TaxID=703497 RepID=A0A6A6U6H9_9PEZI|nr:calcium dependent mitochondrial carrier protein-like protein [Microthyrium microscopicum]